MRAFTRAISSDCLLLRATVGGCTSYRGPDSGLVLKFGSWLFAALFRDAQTFVQNRPPRINLSPEG
jgi:hypothetical protein